MSFLRPTVLFAASLVIAGLTATGQVPAAPERPRVAAPRPVRPVPAQHRTQAGPMLIETSAPILNLFNKAEEGIARNDWKLAIDSLQRVIDDPEGSLVDVRTVEGDQGTLFESARRQASRRIGVLPPEGLEAYRLLYDGKAKNLLERGRTDHDAAALRMVAERYLLTDHGDEACDQLASWALDERRPAEALALLSDLHDLVPDSDVPRERVAGKLAAAYAMLGQPEQMEPALQAFSESAHTILPWINDLRPIGDDDAPTGSLEDRWASGLPSSARAGYASTSTVEPQVGESGWAYLLPRARSDWWRWIHDEDPAAPLALPGSRLTSDGRRWFVRLPKGCAALDPEDLSVIWESYDPRGAAVVRRSAAQGAGRGGVNPGARGAADDQMVDLVSAAHGLVFVIERGGVVRTTNRRAAGAANAVGADLSTRIVAWDAETGALRWELGDSDDPASPLTRVQFRAPPIAVGDELWVPFFRLADFHIAVLRPRDGAVLRTVLLGSIQETLNPDGPPALLTYADGVVFVPTGFSTLFAVDAADATIRWARQYGRESRSRSAAGVAPGKAWLASEPLVTGGLVILAATDQRDLLAFSAASGETRWAAPVDGGAYLIAADSRRVWVGGRSVSSLALSNGESLWTTHLIAAPTGRAVLCGDRLHVPTSQGLLSLDAEGGTALGVQSIPSPQPPLGNLSASATALYSLDPTSVRKFPDVQRTYTSALARYERDPSNVVVAVRLAWAELFLKQPRRAWERVKDLTTAGDRATESASLARVRVESALRLADAETPGSPQAMSWLRAAHSAAATPADGWRCGTAISDQHAAGGRFEEAYRVLVDLGVSAPTEPLVHLDEFVEIAARTDVTRRMGALERHLSADQRRRLAAEFATRVGGALPKSDERRGDRETREALESWSVLDRNGIAGRRATLTLARWERDRRAYERSEVRLRGSTRQNSDPLMAAAAQAELCALYDASAQDWPEALRLCLNELEARYAAVVFNDPVLTPARMTAGQSVGDWVAKTRSSSASADSKVGAAVPAPDPMQMLTLTPDYAWTRAGSDTGPTVPARIVDMDASFSPAMDDRAYVQRPDGSLESIDALRGETLWQTQLNLPGEFLKDAPLPFNSPTTDAARRAVAEGQIGVFNADDGLFAVGLQTGRRLWVRPYDVVEDGAAVLRDNALAAADGIVAAMPHEGRLSLLRLQDGSTLWERDLRGESVEHVAISDHRVITVDAALERVHLLDRDDGRLVRQVLFEQPGGGGPALQLVRTNGRIIGPEVVGLANVVFAVDLTSGESVWRVDLELPLLQLFKPAEGYVGLALGQGVVRILDAATGELVLERQVPGGRSANGGVMVDGTFVVRIEGTKQQKASTELTAFDVATGELLWQRTDIDFLPSVRQAIPVYDGLIPAVTEGYQTEVSSGGAANRRLQQTLALIDVRTGLNAGGVVDLSGLMNQTRFTGDVVLRSGVLMVSTPRGLYAYKTKAVPRQEAGRNF